MPPKKLILNPPRNPSQQPTPRIKFTNLNKNTAQPGITVDEEARRRQDEHVRAAAQGQVARSTDTPVRASLPRAASRDSPSAGTAPVASAGVKAPSRRSASVVSRGAPVDEQQVRPEDSSKNDDPRVASEPPQLPEKPEILQDGQQAVTSVMKPPAVIPQQTPSLAHAPPSRPPGPITTAFDRITRNPGTGKAAYYRTHH